MFAPVLSIGANPAKGLGADGAALESLHRCRKHRAVRRFPNIGITRGASAKLEIVVGAWSGSCATDIRVENTPVPFIYVLKALFARQIEVNLN